VSDVVTLTLRTPLEEPLEVEGVTGDRCATLAEVDIARLPVWLGSHGASVGDFFDVRGGRSSSLRFEGALERVDALAAGNASGDVMVMGAAGSRVAAGMTGGRVEIHGAVGHDAGAAMAGGALLVHGDAGDRLGSALPGAARGMTGGEIVVRGSAGAETASLLRRGLVVVGGSVGPHAGRAMIAGTLVALGDIVGLPGRGNKRGSIVACGRVEVPSTYQYACSYEPLYLRLLLRYLAGRYGLAVDAGTGPWRRYCGDAGQPGKGEILVRVDHALGQSMLKASRTLPAVAPVPTAYPDPM
jgi:formylmethanofuran dehydrogenase subunit C